MALIQNPGDELMRILMLIVIEHSIILLDRMHKSLVVKGAR